MSHTCQPQPVERKIARHFYAGERCGGIRLVVQDALVDSNELDLENGICVITLAEPRLRNIFSVTSGEARDQRELEVLLGDGQLVVTCGVNQRFQQRGLSQAKRAAVQRMQPKERVELLSTLPAEELKQALQAKQEEAGKETEDSREPGSCVRRGD